MSLLKKFFGPSKVEIWHQLSNEIDGNFISGGFWKSDKVTLKHKEWTITLDTYSVAAQSGSMTYTRMRVPYENKDKFFFTIYPEGLFSTFGKILGMQDIIIGFPEFDKKFIIKSNNPDKIKKLLQNEEIRNLIKQQPDIHFEVKDDEGWFGEDFPEGIDELYFEVPQLILDVERLRKLYELFAVTLDLLFEYEK